MALEILPLGGVSADVLVTLEAGNRALAALNQGRYLLTAQEFNSLVVTLATTMDFIADPVASQKNSGSRYVEETFYGPKAVFGDWNGKEVGVVGAYAEPKDGDAKTWWDALAEVVLRLKSSRVTEGTVDQPAGTPTIVEVVGVAVAAAVPQNQLTGKSMLLVNDKLAPILLRIFLGGGTYAARAIAASRGTPMAAVANETDNKPLAVRMAALYQDNLKKGLGVAAMVTGGLMVVGGIGAVVVKRKRVPVIDAPK